MVLKGVLNSRQTLVLWLGFLLLLLRWFLLWLCLLFLLLLPRWILFRFCLLLNLAERDKILAVKDELAPFVSAPPDQWFKPEVFEDPEYETGKFVRSQVKNNRCVFINPNGRGCGIHTFALKTGRDYHSIKPLVCWLFPVTWDKGVLRPSHDVTDDLVCRETGATLYEFARDEIRVVFGEGLVAELDAIRPSV